MVSCFFVEEMLRIRRRAIGLRVLRTRDEVLRVGRRVMRLDERTRERVERRAYLRRKAMMSDYVNVRGKGGYL